MTASTEQIEIIRYTLSDDEPYFKKPQIEICNINGHCGYISYNYKELKNPFTHADKAYITALLRAAFASHNVFMTELLLHGRIQIIKNMHFDVPTIPDTLHINATFYNEKINEVSATYHLYIKNDAIYTATALIYGQTTVLF